MNNSKDCKTAKLASYLGLSIRAGKAVFGADNVNETSCRVVVADNTLSQNTLKKLDNRCKLMGIPLIMIDGLGELIARPSCKVIGVKEPNLARAIIKAIDTVFEGE